MSLQDFGAEAGLVYAEKGNPQGFESYTTCKQRDCVKLAVPGSRYCAKHGTRKTAPPVLEIPKLLN